MRGKNDSVDAILEACGGTVPETNAAQVKDGVRSQQACGGRRSSSQRTGTVTRAQQEGVTAYTHAT